MIMSYPSLIVVSLFIIFIRYAQGVLCYKTPVVFVFGDSNSDTGGKQSMDGIMDLDPYGRLFPQNPSGRACDGRLVIDFLCETLNINFVTPYLFSFYQNYTNGCNFAIAGADVINGFGFKLQTEINQFNWFKNHSIDLQSRARTDLISQEGFKSAMYVFDIGQNDLYFTSTFDHSSYETVVEQIPIMLQVIKSSILNITGSGGKKFWIHSSGPLGCLPAKTFSLTTNSSDLDQYGCVKYLNEAAKTFNLKLKELVMQLRYELKGSAVFVFVDVYTIKYNIIANAASYGFQKPYLRPCKFTDATGLETICSTGSKLIFVDDFHYTEAANQIVASDILSSKYSDPPIRFDQFSRWLLGSDALEGTVIENFS